MQISARLMCPLAIICGEMPLFCLYSQIDQRETVFDGVGDGVCGAALVFREIGDANVASVNECAVACVHTGLRIFL